MSKCVDAAAPVVSVLIPTFERAAQLSVTLDAWREHLASRSDTEVIVVPDSVVDTPFQRYGQRRLHFGTERRTSGRHLGWTGFWFATMSLPRHVPGDPRFRNAFEGDGRQDHERGVRLCRPRVQARFLREAETGHQDRGSFPSAERTFEKLGLGAWMFSCLHPTLRVRHLTGILDVSGRVRPMLPIDVRARRARSQRDEDRSDADGVAMLEAAYGRGRAKGAARAYQDDGNPRRST